MNRRMPSATTFGATHRIIAEEMHAMMMWSKLHSLAFQKRHRRFQAPSANFHSRTRALQMQRERRGGRPLACIIDFCINNAIMGVEELDAYAQTEGER